MPGRTALVFLLLITCTSPAISQTLTTVVVPNAIAGGGGTGTQGFPYAVFVRIQNWAACAGAQAYLKLYSSTNNEYMWTGSTWSNATTYSLTNQPVVTIDAGGNWSGWVYAKHNNALGVSASVRAAKTTATSTNLTSTARTFTILTTALGGNGGWIVRTTSPAVNKGILAYSAGAVVGTYRTEDNGIAEGYTYGPGGFKIAVPIGFIDSLVALNDDGTVDRVISGPWMVGAGQETDASIGGGLIGRGSARISPPTLQGGMHHSLKLTILGEAPFTITNARITVPTNWSWSHTVADLTVQGGGTPSLTVANDTVVIAGMTVTGTDSVHLVFQDLVPPDSTAPSTFTVKTGVSADSIYPIAGHPSVFVYSIPRPIAVVKENDANGVPLRNNTLVTVRGVVTVANEFGGPSYIEDNSGGLAVFGSVFSTAVSLGDEVIVSGLVQPFSGLTEIVNPILHSIVSSGNTVVPLVVAASQVRRDGAGGVEVYEGRLVRLRNVTVLGTGTWSAGTNYLMMDETDTVQIRIDNNTSLVGAPVPASSFDVIGVVGQFVSNSPYIGGYQIMPRFTGDIMATGPVISSFPVEDNITSTGLSLSWTTEHGGTTRLRYGRTSSHELGVIAPDDTLRTTHRVNMGGLQPATIYHVRVFSVAGGDTSSTADFVVGTASPPPSTGAINVYFNKSIDPRVALSHVALGNQDLVARLVTRVNSARRSIDAAFYSLSGTPGPGTDIAGALIAARGRGVRVRVICEQDNRNTSPLNALANAGIPLITDAFDAVNGGAGLMHNKFVVIDGTDGAPDSAWVWTGSWNPTLPGTSDDYQNAVEIQDLALARAYATEFNEMWGSDGTVPNAATTRFGARKTDNTPHRFVVGGLDIECYFSPSDRVTSHILETLEQARHSISFALLTLTRSDVANVLAAKSNTSVAVRGVLDNSTDQGSQFSFLMSRGVDVLLKTGSGLLHHKYALIDATTTSPEATVITGSHNWTNSAETTNNENTLVIRGKEIANAYLQEFTARYYQFGGKDSVKVGVEDQGPQVPSTFALLQNFPNPFNPGTVVSFQLPVASHVTLVVYDLLGRIVRTLVDESKPAGVHRVQFDATGLASGVYLYRINAGTHAGSRKMVVVK